MNGCLLMIWSNFPLLHLGKTGELVQNHVHEEGQMSLTFFFFKDISGVEQKANCSVNTFTSELVGNWDIIL